AIPQHDAITAEINPLVVTGEGQLVAGDAKLETDENASWRQRVLEERYGGVLEGDPYELEAKKRNLTYVSLDGEVGIIGNGAGLCMGTLDMVQRAGGRAANFCDIGGGALAEAGVEPREGSPVQPTGRGGVINDVRGTAGGGWAARWPARAPAD